MFELIWETVDGRKQHYWNLSGGVVQDTILMDVQRCPELLPESIKIVEQPIAPDDSVFKGVEWKPLKDWRASVTGGREVVSSDEALLMLMGVPEWSVDAELIIANWRS